MTNEKDGQGSVDLTLVFALGLLRETDGARDIITDGPGIAPVNFVMDNNNVCITVEVVRRCAI